MSLIFLDKKKDSGYDGGDMTARFHIPPFRRVFFVLLGVGVVALFFIIATREGVGSGVVPEQAPPATGVYAADVQLETLPEPLKECLIILSAEDMAGVPEADGFQWPCGTSQAAMTYDAQPFGVHNEYRTGYHTGMDINGIGGENTDVGLPVRAAGRGLVVYSGVPGERWGNVVVLAHRLPGTARIVQTLYAHLDERKVSPGQRVSRGQEIGTIGTANNHYLGHLHFEAVESRCIEAGSVAYHQGGTTNRMNPGQLIADYPPPPLPDAYAAVRRIRIREAYNAEKAESQEPVSLPADAIPVNPSSLITP